MEETPKPEPETESRNPKGRSVDQWRIGAIYRLSAYFGTLMAALFVRDSPVVSSSGALFGLLGATLSALTRNWEFYTKKAAALLILFIVAVCNFMLGLLPYVDNYANIGGLVSGILLGFVLLFSPQLKQLAENNKSGLYECNVKRFFNWKLKLDRPVPRIVSLLLFSLLLGALLVASIFWLRERSLGMILLNTETSAYQIWAMLEVGAAQSFTHLYTIDWVTGLTKGLGFWRNHYLFQTESGQLIMCDPSKRETKAIYTHHTNCIYSVVPYIASDEPLSVSTRS